MRLDSVKLRSFTFLLFWNSLKNMNKFKALIFTLPFLFQFPAQASGRNVTATVYDSWFDGRIAYCGKTYHHWGISAAHSWLPCGTKVKVSYAGRNLTVPITDRCNCNSLDLSAGAASYLGVPLNGIATVKISY